MTQFSPDLIRFVGHLGGIYSLGFLCFFGLLIILSIWHFIRSDAKLENRLFWVFASLLVAFSALRPMGITRDDLAYIEIVSRVCSFIECPQLPQSTRDWGWYFMASILKSFVTGERAVLILSGIGVFIQLLIIYRLCQNKLLALTLFIPLIYLYFDFTLLRAGLALTAFFVGFYFLVNSRRVLGSLALLGNYLFHSQGIFSIGIIPFQQIAKYKHFSIALISLLISCIYLEWTPSFGQLSFLGKHESTPYWGQYLAGLFATERLFPAAHMLIIAYAIFVLLLNKALPETNTIEQYALASILLAVFLAWFFAPIHAMQTRLFDFYLAPLVFIAGNLRLTKTTLATTLGLAILLYIRMELLHNWIIG